MPRWQSNFNKNSVTAKLVSEIAVCDVHKVIPVGLYGLGAYVWRAYFLYRAEPDSPRNEQRATNVENEKQDEHQHQHRTVITIKTLFYIML